jgi:hypothetical protein
VGEGGGGGGWGGVDLFLTVSDLIRMKYHVMI